MSQSVPYEPIHTLSEKSRRLQRNFFLWSDRVVGGLHLDENHQLSAATLRRWILLVFNEHASDFENADVFEIRPVNICFSQAMLFNYAVCPAGDTIDLTSTEALAPGDIGICRPGTKGPVVDELPLLTEGKSFAFLKKSLSDVGGLEWGEMSVSFQEEVKVRDSERCIFTGTSSNQASLVIRWIYPPFLASFNMEEDMRQYLSVSNALTMREDLAKGFEENEFGVDVDDNYRIVSFVPSASSYLLPRTHLDLSHLSQNARPSDEYLRGHFIRCLVVNFLGGDISEIYEDVDPDEFWEERGVFDEDYDFDEQEWHTELGREAKALLFRRWPGRYQD
ncbi:hypothetical protein SCP_0804120 [Sparassis crispa]|uniref:HNH nuclease domain-containing protein n=1 Tax=Sparassis crispa TaxID=139825 RepID=A0A401GUJ0_9APHY|nr:hypothetical protein SCP_0804120 [Sparassis crispa]GBE85888.1 hypothetical protein SCP_0804120 [Sparassis crispa]